VLRDAEIGFKLALDGPPLRSTRFLGMRAGAMKPLGLWSELPPYRCRANLAQIRQSRPYSGLVSYVKVRQTVQGVSKQPLTPRVGPLQYLKRVENMLAENIALE